MIWLALTMAACVVGLLVAVRTERTWLEWLTKSAAAACFLAVALHEGALGARWGQVLFAGLVLAACGDLLLIPKSKSSFLLGLVAFLLGHVLYAIAFAVRGARLDAVACVGVLAAVVAIPVLRWLWPHVERPMRGPVAAYVAVITTMVALAAGTFWHEPGGRIAIGAVAFYLSDLSVARDRFVAKSFVNKAWGLPLYFGAQLLLAWSVSQ